MRTPKEILLPYFYITIHFFNYVTLKEILKGYNSPEELKTKNVYFGNFSFVMKIK